MEKIKFPNLSTSDKIAMLNLTFSLYQAGIIDIYDGYKTDRRELMLDALVEQAMLLLERSELMKCDSMTESND